MLPAHNQIAARGVVPVVSESAGSELELDAHTLQPLALPIDAPLGLAIREGCVNGFDDETEFVADHPEEEDNALLVDGRVAQTAKVDGRTVFGAFNLGP